MEISRLYPSAAPSQPAVRGQSQEDQFLAIMIQQLRAQDPLEPMDNGEFLQQISQFSQMEQFQGLNDNLLQMLALQSELTGLQQLSEATGLIGKTIDYRGEGGETHQGVVERVSLQNGFVRLEVDGKTISLADLLGVGASSSGSGSGEGASA